MTYSVKELFYTLQGEGMNAGQPAVFCRFAGCNLWTGLEKDRANAVCQFCDTDFVGTDGPNGGKFANADDLADAAAKLRPKDYGGPLLLVCTGGEPLLQLDEALVDAFKTRGFRVAVETNGTIAAPANLDWVCVSPKAGANLVQTSGHELKLVYPQPAAMPEQFTDLAFDHFLLQPMDGPDQAKNTRAALDYCRSHPRWRLSLQTHKILDIP